MFEVLALLLAAARAGLRTRRDLVVENALLRHQLAVLTRPTRKRPTMRTRDKLLWVVARRLCRDWRRHRVLVRPETWSAGIAAAGASCGAGARGAGSAARA